MLDAIVKLLVYWTGGCLCVIMLYSMRSDVVMSVVTAKSPAPPATGPCSDDQNRWYPIVQSALAGRLDDVASLMDFNVKFGPPDAEGLRRMTIKYYMTRPARAKVYTATGTLSDKDCRVAISTIER